MVAPSVISSNQSLNRCPTTLAPEKVTDEPGAAIFYVVEDDHVRSRLGGMTREHGSGPGIQRRSPEIGRHSPSSCRRRSNMARTRQASGNLAGLLFGRPVLDHVPGKQLGRKFARR